MQHLSWLIDHTPLSTAASTTKRTIVVAPHSVWLLYVVFFALFLCYSAAAVNGLSFFIAPKSKTMIVIGCGMTKHQAFWHSQRQKQQHATSWTTTTTSTSPMSTLVMRDKSASYWFQAGDTVRVVENVYMGSQANRVNLLSRVGTVLQTWEKCNVDPTCCCAEQVNPEMAVHVQFFSSQEYSSSSKQENGNGENQDSSFTYYFSEEELVQVNEKEEVQEENTQTTAAASPNVTPFDGMSCTAFKLEELQKMGQKPRGIASFDPQQNQNIP